jgi:hypothetical protein
MKSEEAIKGNDSGTGTERTKDVEGIKSEEAKEAKIHEQIQKEQKVSKE